MPRKITITLTRYAEPDGLVAQALAHALRQEGIEGEVLFVEQDTCASFDLSGLPQGALELRVVTGKLGGLSQARNRALEMARHDVILFLDADALADPDWALRMAEALDDPAIAVVGSRIVPGWPASPPAFARARVLRDQYSLLELGEDTQPANRVVGAGFGVDRAKLPQGFAFDTSLGRREGRLFGGEESDFCHRVQELGHGIAYVGGARVTHLVQPERMKLGWILKRMIYAGHGRARQGGAPNPSRKPGLADWLWLPVYLPPYLLGWLWGKLGR